MIRFTMPDPALALSEQIQLLRGQFDAFLQSPALLELFTLLRADRHTLGELYNGRKMADGSIRETQELEPAEALNEKREALYPLLRELGFFGINRPLCTEHSHVLVLGGSLETCFVRTRCAKAWLDPSTRFVDGLSCFRPIHPNERRQSTFPSRADTEFGAMSDSFTELFQLSPVTVKDDFHGDRNLNRISCVRIISAEEGAACFRVFAAPSSQPELRRADTGDTLRFYLRNGLLRPTDSVLAITNNQYCSRQFVQLAYQLMKEACPVRLDVIGCTADERIVPPERYDPFQFLQSLIGLLDWIERFENTFAP